METLITNGIRISVDPQFEPQHSNPLHAKFLFSYHITIENLSEYPVQLMARHWHIFDSIGIKREVIGDGVIGQQPILEPRQVHEYSSWCPLTTGIGKMYGHYKMQRLDNDYTFEVEIPSFDLIAPIQLN
ncbi:MAG: Co2+/Mg2+ efflux protein ApaG [Saprospiraceae bacterium]|nr:Co2+/Mg2+ efflux protein ApaG [Saprospiraceae bacterium]